MHTALDRLFSPRVFLALVLVLAVGAFYTAHAAPVAYTAILTGASEVPPNASPGTGTALVEIDAVAHTMHINAVFSGLIGTTTASHIHAATAVAGAGTAGVATTTPSFALFPLGVTAGSFDNTLDMTQASSYNPSYVTNHGGTTAQAEADLFQAIADGKAYLNIHSSFATGGEIRGFLTPKPLATEPTTWGKVKALYR